MNYLERITLNKHNFTKSDFIINSFVAENPQAVEDVTISTIAKLAGVSISAVLRYCQRLGYSGYSEFRFDLIKTLHSSEVSTGTSLLQDYLKRYAYGVAELEKTPTETISKLVQLIVDAPFIQCLGSVNSSLPAMKFYYDFTAIGKRVLPLTGALTPWVDAALNAEDLIIIFSATGKPANESVLDFLTRATEFGCEIVLVTCNSKAKLAQYATLIMEIPLLRMNNDITVEAQSLMMMMVTILAAYTKQYI